MVQNFINGGGAVNQLAEAADADLRVYELDLDRPTRDFTTGPAMTEEGCARAMAYGMMAVEQGLHVICLGEMGIANTTSAAALCTALFGGEPSDWVGPGTGVDAKGLGRKAETIAEGLKANPGALDDPLEALRCLGGFELAAIAGAVAAARLARTPVVLDGYACTAAAAVLAKLDPRALDHCIVAHRSAEPGHARLLEKLGKQPLFDFGMRLGEGSGAALGDSDPEGGGRVPQRHGDLRGGGRQRTGALTMRRAALAFIVLSGAMLWAGGAAAAELRVTVRGVKSAEGDVKVGLYATPEAFDKRQKTFGASSPARPGEVVVVFHDLPPGRYGLAVLHDLNSNGEMDNNLLGFPKEPFGFGNDAKINLAPPAFADMAVTVGNGVTETVVNLRNN